MSWRRVTLDPSLLRTGGVVSDSIVAETIERMVRSRSQFRYPLVRGLQVIRGKHVVEAAKRLRLNKIAVLQATGRQRNGRPPVLPLTHEQRAVIDCAVRRFRDLEQEPGEHISDGRALELICADYLAGVGWPTQ